MAKDSKGHGSNGRGGADARLAQREQAMFSAGKPGLMVRPDKAAEYAANKAASKAETGELGSMHSSNQDAAAARTLAEPGHPKSAPVPVHGGATGRSDLGSMHSSNETSEGRAYNRDLALRVRNGQVGSGMKLR
jgi:hypothetical protein